MGPYQVSQATPKNQRDRSVGSLVCHRQTASAAATAVVVATSYQQLMYICLYIYSSAHTLHCYYCPVVVAQNYLGPFPNLSDPTTAEPHSQWWIVTGLGDTHSLGSNQAADPRNEWLLSLPHSQLLDKCHRFSMLPKNCRLQNNGMNIRI